MVTARTESPLNGFAAALRLKLRHLNLASPTHESRVVPNSIGPDPFVSGDGKRWGIIHLRRHFAEPDASAKRLTPASEISCTSFIRVRLQSAS